MRRMLFLVLMLIAFWLPACGTSSVLSNVSLSSASYRPTVGNETLTISYHIGRNARVSVVLLNGNERYVLRNAEQRLASNDAYALRFDGTAPTNDPVLTRKLLPAGNYTVLVEADAIAEPAAVHLGVLLQRDAHAFDHEVVEGDLVRRVLLVDRAGDVADAAGDPPVSYTHLTLPTNREV